MSRPTVDEWAFKQIKDYAERSTCYRRKVGALGLDRYGRIAGIGMNGVPRDWYHCGDEDQWFCFGAKQASGSPCDAIHAEVNMILNSGSPYDIEVVYVSVTPCYECSKILANLPNLKKVKALDYYSDREGLAFFGARGVEVEIVRPGSGDLIIS